MWFDICTITKNTEIIKEYRVEETSLIKEIMIKREMSKVLQKLEGK